MDMITKTLLAAGTAALMTGSFVYFGLPALADSGQTLNAAATTEVSDDSVVAHDGDDHPHRSTLSDGESKSEPTVALKSEGASKPSSHQASADDANADEPQRRWIDQYIKPDAKRGTDVDAPKNAMPTRARDTMLPPTDMPVSPDGRDAGSKIDTSLEAARARVKAIILQAENAPKSLPESALESKRVEMQSVDTSLEAARARVRDVILRAEAENGSQSDRERGRHVDSSTITVAPDVAIQKHESKRVRSAQTPTSKTPKPMRPGQIPASNSDYGVDRLLTAANDIQDVALRDQAYFGVVEYALKSGKTDKALDVLAMIDRKDLRNTARSRVVVELARQGRLDEGFDIVEQIDDPELRDIIRLQAIETVTLMDKPLKK